MRSSPAILALIGMNLIVVVFGMPYQTLMPVFSERVYAAGATGLGLLLAGSGAGALAGGARAHHPLDLVGRVALPADGKQRRGGGKIDGIHDALDFG